MPHANRTVAFLVTLLGLSLWTPPSVLAQSCVVLTTADSTAAEPTVPDSLRDCLDRVRAGDEITFDANIFDLANSSAVTTIQVLQPLPPLDDGNVTIDASNRRVSVNGSGTVDASGLVITSNGNTVRGLNIIGFPRSGIRITSASDSVIGGDDPGEGNTVAYNGGTGIEVRGVDSRRNSARGNRITSNVKGGIALFDGSNDGIQPPVITSIQDLGPSSSGTGSTLRISGTTAGSGSVEVFSDSGSQGETLVRRGVTNGAFEADIDVSDILNRTATFTDAAGNTSPFGVFGLTAGDADGDGVSSALETLAQTDPGNPLDTPALVGTLDPKKLQVKLNFAKANKDSLSATIGLVLPDGFVVPGATVGVQIGGHVEQLVLDAKGKASGTGKMALKIAKGTFDGVLKYAVKDASLLAEVATFGLAEKTTPKSGEGWVLPVAVTTTGSVYLGSATLTYKATQGKTGKAKK